MGLGRPSLHWHHSNLSITLRCQRHRSRLETGRRNSPPSSFYFHPPLKTSPRRQSHAGGGRRLFPPDPGGCWLRTHVLRMRTYAGNAYRRNASVRFQEMEEERCLLFWKEGGDLLSQSLSKKVGQLGEGGSGTAPCARCRFPCLFREVHAIYTKFFFSSKILKFCASKWMSHAHPRGCFLPAKITPNGTWVGRINDHAVSGGIGEGGRKWSRKTLVGATLPP